MWKHDPKIEAQLASRIELSKGLAIFRFELERELVFHPGQYATMWLTHRGKTIARPFSIASSPSENHVLEFYINLVRKGKLTPSLWQTEVIDGLNTRDPETRVAFTGPAGRFTLDPRDMRDLVFIASGTGLAPFMSMIRSLNENYLASPRSFRPHRIYLIHGVSLSSHLGYREELEKLASASRRNSGRKLILYYLPTISRPHMDSDWTGLTGRAETLLDVSTPHHSGLPDLQICAKIMLHASLRPETHMVYVSGHPGTIDGVVRTLSPRGFRLESDIKSERYYR